MHLFGCEVKICSIIHAQEKTNICSRFIVYGERINSNDDPTIKVW